MSRRPATFTKADLARAMAVARANNMTVEVAPDGTIRIVPVDAGSVANGGVTPHYAGEIKLW